MATINYFIRNDKKDNLSNIYVRLKEGRSLDLTTKSGKFIKPNYWSNKKGTVSLKAEFTEKDDLIKDLRELQLFIEKEFLKVNDKSNPGPNWLKTTVERFNNPSKFLQQKDDLFTFIDNFIKDSESRINPATGKRIAKSTLKKYGTCLYHLRNYSMHIKSTLDFDDITVKFYYEFTQYLTKNCNLATNTVGKQIAILKGFLGFATEQGYNTRMDFRSRNFKITTEDSEAVYLNEIELANLWEHNFSENQKLERIRDLFLIGCWTGCRFSDLASVNTKNIKGEFLYLEQEKTGNKVMIPLHPVVKEILAKYQGELPRMVTNQKFNEYIKEVCKEAKINSLENKSITRGGVRESSQYLKWELVSSHTARRSFATNLYKSGFPSYSIMAITGHRTEKAFLKYIKVTPEEHANLLQEHWKKTLIKDSKSENGQ